MWWCVTSRLAIPALININHNVKNIFYYSVTVQLYRIVDVIMSH